MIPERKGQLLVSFSKKKSLKIVSDFDWLASFGPIRTQNGELP